MTEGVRLLDLVPATDADWDAAWAIQREALEDLVTRTWGGWTDEQVRRCADAWDPATTRLVRVDGDLVGWIRLEHRSDHDWLDLIVIASAHRDRGLGGEVIRRLLDDTSARDVPLWLSVYRTNPARRLHARLGFVEVPRDDIRVFMVCPATAERAPPG